MAKDTSARDALRAVERELARRRQYFEAEADGWAERLTTMMGIAYRRGELKVEEFRAATAGFEAADAMHRELKAIEQFVTDLIINL